MIVEILKSCEHTGVRAGEFYEAIRYHLDPNEKVVLQKRLPDGYDPDCTEYLYNVRIVPEAPDVEKLITQAQYRHDIDLHKYAYDNLRKTLTEKQAALQAALDDAHEQREANIGLRVKVKDARDKDLRFLREIQKRYERSSQDQSQREFVQQMIEDWIDELESALTTEGECERCSGTSSEVLYDETGQYYRGERPCPDCTTEGKKGEDEKRLRAFRDEDRKNAIGSRAPDAPKPEGEV